MPQRVLTAAHLNRALLARQRFLERDDLSIPAALEAIGGIQDQYAPAGYIGLWTRLREFRRAALTEALEAREVVQATLMRSTIHLVSAADYPLLAAGTGPARRAWLERVQGGRLTSKQIERAVDVVRAELAEGPRRQKDLQAALVEKGFDRLGWIAASQWVDMVRVPPSGTWDRRRADLYGLAEDWVDGMNEATEEDGLDLLLRRYLEGFGPAPLADAATWAGVPTTRLGPSAERLDLVTYRDEAGKELLDLPGLPLPDPETPAPVRLLPVWEASLLVHARRSGILPEEHRPRIFNTKTPHSVDTILVDGKVAGTWRHEDGRVAMRPFGDLPARVMRELREEADRLEAFYSEG
jgi:Winged helix DNA-binding domain